DRRESEGTPLQAGADGWRRGFFRTSGKVISRAAIMTHRNTLPYAEGHCCVLILPWILRISLNNGIVSRPYAMSRHFQTQGAVERGSSPRSPQTPWGRANPASNGRRLEVFLTKCE